MPAGQPVSGVSVRPTRSRAARSTHATAKGSAGRAATGGRCPARPAAPTGPAQPDVVPPPDVGAGAHRRAGRSPADARRRPAPPTVARGPRRARGRRQFPGRPARRRQDRDRRSLQRSRAAAGAQHRRPVGGRAERALRLAARRAGVDTRGDRRASRRFAPRLCLVGSARRTLHRRHARRLRAAALAARVDASHAPADCAGACVWVASCRAGVTRSSYAFATGRAARSTSSVADPGTLRRVPLRRTRPPFLRRADDCPPVRRWLR